MFSWEGKWNWHFLRRNFHIKDEIWNSNRNKSFSGHLHNKYSKQRCRDWKIKYITLPPLPKEINFCFSISKILITFGSISLIYLIAFFVKILDRKYMYRPSQMSPAIIDLIVKTENKRLDVNLSSNQDIGNLNQSFIQSLTCVMVLFCLDVY